MATLQVLGTPSHNNRALASVLILREYSSHVADLVPTAVEIEGMICLILPALLVSLNPHSNVLRGVDSQTVQMFAPFGQHSVTFDVPNVASGAYLCMVEAGRFVDVKKLLLLC